MRPISVPDTLIALSARASEDWQVDRKTFGGRDRVFPGVVRAGPAFEYTNGSCQSQIASFSAPRLAEDDCRDSGDIQQANTDFAVACVNWVRELIAARESGDPLQAGRTAVAVPSVLVTQQGAVAVRTDAAHDVHAGRDVVAFRVDLDTKYAEIYGRSYGQDELPEIYLAAGDQSLNLYEGAARGLGTILQFPDYLGWAIHCASVARYTLSVTLTAPANLDEMASRLLSLIPSAEND